MPILALDVDGVLLDPDRAGRGHWTIELEQRLGISRDDLRVNLFAPRWPDVIVGRIDLRVALADALTAIGSAVSVDAVMDCWFEADLVVIEATVALARRAVDAGVQVVLATNQEHRRAAFLRRHVATLFPIADVLYSAALGGAKPEAVFFDAASARLDVADRSTIVFADDAQENVDAARAAGWSAHLATSTNGWIDAVVADLGID